MPIRHVVMLKLNDDMPKAAQAALKAAFYNLPNKFEGAHSASCGFDAGINTAASGTPAANNVNFTGMYDFPDAATWKKYVLSEPHLSMVTTFIKPYLDVDAPNKINRIQFEIEGTTKPEGIVRHLVFLKFKDGVSADAMAKAKEQFLKFPEALAQEGIPGCVGAQCGFDAGINDAAPGTPPANTHSFCGMVDFVDAESWVKYVPSKTHTGTVGTYIKPNLAEPIVVTRNQYLLK